MSSISIVNQTQLLDSKNKIKLEENKIIKEKIVKRNLKNSSLSSSQNDTVINLVAKKKSHLYTISSNQISLNRKNVLSKENLPHRELSKINISQFKKHINSFISKKSIHKSIRTKSTEINKDNNTVVKVANKLMDIGETTFTSSVSFTKKIIHIFMHHLNKVYVEKVIDEKIIKKIVTREEKVSIKKIYNNEIKSADNKNSNNALTNKKNSTNNISLNQPKNNNALSSAKSEYHVVNWEPINSLKNSVSVDIFINQYQDNFNRLKQTNHIDKNFFYVKDNSTLIVNGNKIVKSSPIDMLNQFKKIIPNLESRQLISSYLSPSVFTQIYYSIYSKNPDISLCKQEKPIIVYDVQELNNGKIQFTATNIAGLVSVNKNVSSTYDVFGVKASILLSKNYKPEVTYSSFVE